jgi:hypothetical protein
MPVLTCTAKDGSQNNFEYILSKDRFDGREIWDFMIYPVGNQEIEPFQFAVTILTDSEAKVTTMNNNGMENYSAKGIPEQMILVAHTLTCRKIISSTNKLEYQSVSAESITPQAEKVWKRLVEYQLASQDLYSQIYSLI